MDNKMMIEAISAIADEKNIGKEIIFEALELALVTAYRKNFNAMENVKVDINQETGAIKVFSFLTVVEEIEDDQVEITLEEARKIKDCALGEELLTEVTPADFGRVAATTAKQVLKQKIREAERESVALEFQDKIGELVIGTLSREDMRNYYVDLGRAHGIMPKSEIIPGEELKMNSSIKVYVNKIEEGQRGPVILLSRRQYNFVKRLFEREIPELTEGTVLIKGVAREAGVRSKVAVFSNVLNVDAIGACIGAKGSRIGNIIAELNGEKIDLVMYDEDLATYIANALSPAKNLQVIVPAEEDGNILVIADPDNLSLAIGKGGMNIKLAARLVKRRIDIMTLTDAREKGYDLGFVGDED